MSAAHAHAAEGAPRQIGAPRLHLPSVGSTNARARQAAEAGARDGTLVTAREQTAGRGRQGRTWTIPAGRALALSLVLREPPELLALRAAVAVAAVADELRADGGPRGARGGGQPGGAAGDIPIGAAGVADRPQARTAADAAIKWPNDVLLDGRKVAGILAEARPQDGWAVLGIGLNVAVRARDLPPALRATAATLGLDPAALEPVLQRLLAALAEQLAAPPAAVLRAYRERDALAGRALRWAGGEGVAAGIDDGGRLLVTAPNGERLALSAGEVHLAGGA